jgi:OmpA-OmpF porin, OOP family
MRSLKLIPLSLLTLLAACSQNPHLEVTEPAPAAATTQAVELSSEEDRPIFSPAEDKDRDGTPNKSDLCPDIAGPAENKGCPYDPVADTDQDGVLNEADRCPRVKGPDQNNGCPYDPVLDTDQDGTLNTDDRCPQVKGPVENNGCPFNLAGDRDQDGVLDRQDRCPDLAGPKANGGCPYSDRDGDGLLDQIDACPDVKGPATNNGCPAEKDRDGDGVPDHKDRCPKVPGELAFDGCPSSNDTDRDGIVDDKDACPREAGPKANRGCPYPKEEEKKILVGVMGSLKFDFDEAIITDSSYPALDRLVAFLRKYPSAKLKLVGHTDDVGTDDYNMNLSRERVEAVKTFLVGEGVKADRIQTDARGESEPLVNIQGLEEEELEEAQAQNRRVDMSVRYRAYK